MSQVLSPEIAKRIDIERQIVSKFVRIALKAGYMISVYDGEEVCLQRSTSHDAVMGAIQSTDEDVLILRHQSHPESRSTVHLVYGNDGWDVIADYTVDLEYLMPEVNALADRLER